MISKAHSEAARQNGKLYGGCKPRSPEQLRNDFFKRVDKLGPIPKHRPKLGSCWVWTGGRDVNGYGNFSVRGKPSKAHRFSFEIHTGIIPTSEMVCHHCDNPPCVNPDHLFLGNALTNNWDGFAKGRMKFVPPPKPLINERQIKYIRAHFRPHKTTVTMLAKQLGVSRHSVRWAIYGSYKKPKGHEGADILIQKLEP